MILTRRPEEIFAAEDDTDWNEWVDFFSLTREADGRRKGLVEMNPFNIEGRYPEMWGLAPSKEEADILLQKC